MRVFFDACCFSRLTDDLSQPRVRREAESIEWIFGLVRGGVAQMISSDTLRFELNRNPSVERCLEAKALLVFTAATVETTQQVVDRARGLKSLGYGMFDALHVAAAETEL